MTPPAADASLSVDGVMILVESGDAATDARSVASYVAAFGPAPDWDELVRWPPDVFAFANLVLDHTGAYRFVVAPPRGRRWPPFDGWERLVRETAAAWKKTVRDPPALVRSCWERVTRLRNVSLVDVRSGDAWELDVALLTAQALADEACAGVTASRRSRSADAFEAQAWRLLETLGSLSRFPPARVRIVPKTHFSPRGLTIRSLSRHVALTYEATDVRWRRADPGAVTRRAEYDVVLLPWPLTVRAEDFRRAPPARIANMDRERFGFFEFAPEGSLDCALVSSLIDAAGNVDAVVLPEAAVDAPSL